MTSDTVVSDGVAPDDRLANWVSRLRTAAETGELLDLAPSLEVTPSEADSWPRDQTLPVLALRTVLADSSLRIDPKGLRIRAARFEQTLDLAYVDFPHPLQLLHCSLEAGLDARMAKILELNLADTYVLGEISAQGASIAGELNLKGATVKNPDGYALNLDVATISGGFVGENFRAIGEVRALGATITGQLNLNGANLKNPRGQALNLDGTTINGDVFAGQRFRAIGRLRALDATITGQLNLNGANLKNPRGQALNLDRATIGGSVFAGKQFKATGEVRAVGATINRQLNLNGANLKNPGGQALILDGTTINGGVFGSEEFRADGEVRALGATITGQLSLHHATLENSDGDALSLDRATINGNMIAGKEFKATGTVRIRDATITGQLDLDGAKLKNSERVALDLEGATIASLVLSPASCDGFVDVRRTEITNLVTTDSLPAVSAATGWKIGDLHGPLRERWRAVHGWLKLQQPRDNSTPPASMPVQPWHAVADVYERNGDPAGARHLRLAAAKQVTRQAPWPTKWLRYIYFVTAGNGYYPLFAALWLSLIVAVAVSLVAINREDIRPTDRDEATTAVQQHFVDASGASEFLPVTAETPCEVHPGYPCMNSLNFAINAVLPPAASSNRDWDVGGDATLALTAGLPLLKLFSWALAALLLAGVTGLLRKN